MLTTLAVENYRSLRDLVLPLSGLTVVTGPNGSGKSSLYRALRLLADASRNGAGAGRGPPPQGAGGGAPGGGRPAAAAVAGPAKRGAPGKAGPGHRAHQAGRVAA